MLVEAVDDAGALDAVDAGEVGPQWWRSALTRVLARGRGGVDRHAGGLIDDEEVVVLVDDAEGEVFRMRFGGQTAAGRSMA